jgi:dTDP-4-dehydrorhamnose 3,5-epimerase
MLFSDTSIAGARLIEPEPHHDERGYFARTWCKREFARQGMEAEFVQSGMSYNRKAGTLRGLHYQKEPFAEIKLLRCTRGTVYDVIVDLRPESPTYLKHFSVELSEQNALTLYTPKGVAHGFVTLTDDTTVFYQMSEFYSPGHATGVRYDDPRLRITWPIDVTCISDRDRSWPDIEATG